MAMLNRTSDFGQRDEEYDVLRSNSTPLDSVKTFECAIPMANTSQDSEKEKRGSSEYHTAHDSCVLWPNESSDAPISNPTRPLQSFVYYSARIESMIENRSNFSSELEAENESSKVSWSELDPTSHTEHSGKMNRKYFEELKLAYEEKERRGSDNFLNFFREMDDLVVGKKIGEGAQAEIYEAYDANDPDKEYVVKVFRAGHSLRDLEKQWPPGLYNRFQFIQRPRRYLHSATLLKDERLLNRFAFVMERRWGDLRKLIDLRMVETNQSPPFTKYETWRLMIDIAIGMHSLHNAVPPILHRDLKAANILVQGCTPLDGLLWGHVIDFECSVGVVGTGFWRAPEILQQLQNRGASFTLEFRKESDVYSFGMICYELVTGHIPFEGHSLNHYNLVMNGNRPQLPPDLDPLVKDLITSCWHPNPSHRPSFLDIQWKLWEQHKNLICGLTKRRRTSAR